MFANQGGVRKSFQSGVDWRRPKPVDRGERWRDAFLARANAARDIRAAYKERGGRNESTLSTR
jgi:hypothetical protein